MQTFRDNAGRTWTVAIDVAAIKRVRSLIGYDLLAVLDGTGTQALVSDPVLLVDVLYALCRPEADRLAVTDEDFGRSMAGDAIEHATISPRAVVRRGARVDGASIGVATRSCGRGAPPMASDARWRSARSHATSSRPSHSSDASRCARAVASSPRCASTTASDACAGP